LLALFFTESAIHLVNSLTTEAVFLMDDFVEKTNNNSIPKQSIAHLKNAQHKLDTTLITSVGLMSNDCYIKCLLKQIDLTLKIHVARNGNIESCKHLSYSDYSRIKTLYYLTDQLIEKVYNPLTKASYATSLGCLHLETKIRAPLISNAMQCFGYQDTFFQKESCTIAYPRIKEAEDFYFSKPTSTHEVGHRFDFENSRGLSYQQLHPAHYSGFKTNPMNLRLGFYHEQTSRQAIYSEKSIEKKLLIAEIWPNQESGIEFFKF